MLFFFYGKDTYRMKKKIKEVIQRYKNIHKSGLNFKKIDLTEESLSFKEILDKTSQVSMFKEKKFIIIYNPFSSQEFKEGILKQGEKIIKSEDIVLLCQENEINQKDKFFIFLKKNAKCQEFNLLSGKKLEDWASKEIKRKGGKISETALSKLCSFVGNDLWKMENEINKLLNFKKNNNITDKDIVLLSSPEIGIDIFKTIDAVAQKNKKQAFEFIYNHLEKGDSASYLMAMINYQIKNILIIKSLIEKKLPYGLIIKKSGLNLFVARKTIPQAEKFNLKELKKIYQNLFETDLKIKTGLLEPSIAIDLFISKI